MKKICSRLPAFVLMMLVLCFAGCADWHDEYIRLHPGEAAAPAVTAAPSPTTDKTQSGPGVIVEATFRADINGDDTDETVTVCSNSEIGHSVVLNVSGGEAPSQIEVSNADYKSAFITQTGNGNFCIFISAGKKPGDFKTSVISFEGIKPVLQREVNGRVTRASGTDVTIEDELRIMGSWYYYRDYRLKDDFTFDAVTEYMINMEGKEPLHAIRSVPVEMLAGGVYVKETLRIGTDVYPVSTDHRTYIKFRLEDGSAGKINFLMTGDHTYFIEGQAQGLAHDYEFFDNVEYWK